MQRSRRQEDSEAAAAKKAAKRAAAKKAVRKAAGKKAARKVAAKKAVPSAKFVSSDTPWVIATHGVFASYGLG